MPTHRPQLSESDRPTLVGREREHALLRAWLDATFSGSGGLVLLSGEAGIGKTTLADAVSKVAAGRGALVLTGHCYDRTETPPYGLWVDLFAHWRHREGLLPPPAFSQRGVVGPVASQAALFNQVLDFFQAATATPDGTRAIVLVLDDVHWSDPASLDLLRFLARALANLPLLILALFRSDELARGHPLDVTMPLLIREADAVRLPLKPLAEADIAAYVGGSYALSHTETMTLVRYLYRRSEGNPLFMHELLHMLEDDGVLVRRDDSWTLRNLPSARVPTLLRQIIDARLDRLGEEARRLLEIAAVIGPEIALDLWHDVSGVASGALLDLVERAVRAHILEETAAGTSVTFVHALSRDALYEGMLAQRRRILHLALAKALAAAHHPDPGVIAHHFVQAGDPRAAEWLVRTGEVALRSYAWVIATARFNEALALMREGEADEIARGWIHYCLSLTLRFVAPRDALAHLDALLRSAEAAGDDSLRAGAVFQRGSYRFLLGDTERAIAEMIAGMELLDALPSTQRDRIDSYPMSSVADCHGTLIHYLAWVGRAAEAVRFGERFVIDLADTAGGGETVAIGNGYMGLGVAYAILGRTEAATDAFARGDAAFQSVQVASNLGFGFACLFALVALILPYYADDLARRGEVAAAGEEAWRRDDGTGYNSFPRSIRLPLLVVEGNWSEARSLAEAVCTRPLPATRQLGMSVLGPLARAQGDAERARAVVREMLPAGPTTTPGTLPFAYTLPILRLAAALTLDASDYATARAWLEAHDRWLEWSGAVLNRPEGLLGWAAYHRAMGDLLKATEYATRAAATQPRQPLALVGAHRLLGELATEHGQFADAETHLDDALVLAKACAAPYERALTLLARAELRAATADNAAATALLDEARAILTPLDARPALACADALAARLAAPPPLPANPWRLTEREREILRLLAAGASNREIAVTRGINERTVERHITNIYTKIGADNRVTATGFALRHDLA